MSQRKEELDKDMVLVCSVLEISKEEMDLFNLSC